MIEIAFARSQREEEAIERALESASIAYTFSLDAADAGDRSVCSLGRKYFVSEADAARARSVISLRGL